MFDLIKIVKPNQRRYRHIKYQCDERSVIFIRKASYYLALIIARYTLTLNLLDV